MPQTIVWIQFLRACSSDWLERTTDNREGVGSNPTWPIMEGQDENQ
jgi:hypothetical protein